SSSSPPFSSSGARISWAAGSSMDPRVAERRRRARLGHVAFWTGIWTVALAGLLFLLLPTLVVVLASFTASDYIAFPPEGLSLRWFWQLLAMSEVHTAAWRSVWIAFTA